MWPSSLLPKKSRPGADGHSRSIRRLSHLGYGGIALGFGTFLSWSVMADVASAVIAKGTVSVASTRKSIQHLTGGIVSTIDVKEGDRVRKGQRLMTLDAAETLSQIDILETRLVSSLVKDIRLRTEAGDETAFVLSPEARARIAAETSDGASAFTRDLRLTGDTDGGPDLPAAAEAATAPVLDRAAIAFEDERRLFDARRATRARELEIFDNQKRQLESQAASHADRLAKVDAQLANSTDQVAQIGKLVKKGIVSKSALIDKQRQLGDLQDSRMEIAIQRDAAKGSLDAVGLEELKSEQTRQEDIGKQLSDVRADIGALKVQFDMQRRLLSRMELRAPQDGVVQNLSVRSVGALVAPGTVVLEIVPVSDDLVVSMQLPVNYADQVHAGMPASLRFSGLQSFHTLQMNGTVRRISPDAVPDEQGRRTIVTGEIQLDLANAPPELAARLRPGIDAEIVIPTAERSVASFLVKPLSDAFAHSMRER